THQTIRLEFNKIQRTLSFVKTGWQSVPNVGTSDACLHPPCSLLRTHSIFGASRNAVNRSLRYVAHQKSVDFGPFLPSCLQILQVRQILRRVTLLDREDLHVIQLALLV